MLDTAIRRTIEMSGAEIAHVHSAPVFLDLSRTGGIASVYLPAPSLPPRHADVPNQEMDISQLWCQSFVTGRLMAIIGGFGGDVIMAIAAYQHRLELWLNPCFASDEERLNDFLACLRAV